MTVSKERIAAPRRSQNSDVMATVRTYGAQVEPELKRILSARAKGERAKLYGMLRYFFGFLEADLAHAARKGGKRLRPAVCLLIAEGYGVRRKALTAAAAIELFHNFTLVHDDVEDRDESRHGRPTVWKVWGVNHAINAGDVLLIHIAQVCTRIAQGGRAGRELTDALLRAFVETGEGQYLDIELSQLPVGSRGVNEASYLTMIQKKTAELIAICAEVAGIAASRNARERALLRSYGLSLGMAFQLADDYASVWATSTETRKDAQSDIRERKRALPFVVAYARLRGRARKRLRALYERPRQLSRAEVREVLDLINTTDARAYVERRIRAYADTARASAAKLSLPQKTRRILADIVDTLVMQTEA